MPCAIRRALGYDGSGFTPGTDRAPEENKMRLTLLGTGNALVAVEDGERRRLIGHEVTFFDIRSTKARQFGFSMELDGEGRRLTCCGGVGARLRDQRARRGAG